MITGDTVLNDGLATAANGADVLVSEARAHHLLDLMAHEAEAIGQKTHASVLKDTSRYQINLVEAARLANRAGVHELVYPTSHRRWCWACSGRPGYAGSAKSGPMA